MHDPAHRSPAPCLSPSRGRLLRTVCASILVVLFVGAGAEPSAAQDTPAPYATPYDAEMSATGDRWMEQRMTPTKDRPAPLPQRYQRVIDARRPRTAGQQAVQPQGAAPSIAMGVPVFLPTQQVGGSPWVDPDKNFGLPSSPQPAGDVNNDGIQDIVYRYVDVADERTAGLSDRVDKTLLRFGGNDVGVRLYDHETYDDLVPVGNIVGGPGSDAIGTSGSIGFRVYEGGSDGYTYAGYLDQNLISSFSFRSFDLDGDGYQDILATSGFTSEVDVVFGGPTVSDLQYVRYATDVDATGAYQYTTADVTGDGVEELIRLSGEVTPTSNDLEVRIYGVGTSRTSSLDLLETFRPSIAVSESVNARYIPLRVLDLNGIGEQEIIFSSRASGNSLPSTYVFSRSGGVYDATPIVYPETDIRGVGDLNADGREDVIYGGFTSDTETQNIAFGPANLADGLSADLTIASFLLDEDVGDLTGDGFDNIVQYQADADVLVTFIDFEGQGSEQGRQTFRATTGIHSSGGIRGAEQVGDVDGDGVDDYALIYVEGRAEVYTGSPNAAESPFLSINGPAPFFSNRLPNEGLALGDFTGDGRQNLAIRWNDQDESVNVYDVPSGGTLVHSIGLDDLGIPRDADGLESPADGPNVALANLGDINNDGVDDLGLTLPEIGTEDGDDVYVYLGNAPLSSQPDLVVQSTSRDPGFSFGQTLVGLGDINGDGIDDFAVSDRDSDYTGAEFPPDRNGTNEASGVVFVHYGTADLANGFDEADAIIALPTSELVGSNIRSRFDFGKNVVAGDVNNDGAPDLIATSIYDETSSQGSNVLNVFYGGTDFDTVVDATYEIPSLVGNSSRSAVASLVFGNMSVVRAPQPGGGTGVFIGSYDTGVGALWMPRASNPSEIELSAIFKAPDQQGGMGGGVFFRDVPDTGRPAVGDFDGDGVIEAVLTQRESQDFQETPAYVYQLDGPTFTTPSPSSCAPPQTVVDPSAGQMLVFPSYGIRLEFNGGGSGRGDITVCRYDQTPVSPGVRGQDLNLASYSYSIERDGTLELDEGFELGFSVFQLEGVTDPENLTLYYRSLVGTGVFSAAGSFFNRSSSEILTPDTDFGEFTFTSEVNPLPVELEGLSAQVSGDAVTLTWQTLSETGNDGFQVERRVGTESASSWSRVGFVEGAGTRSTATEYRFADREVPYEAETVAYRLRQVDVDGTESVSDPVRVRFGAPDELRLRKTFPNPATGRVTVRYETPTAAPVQMDLYNVLGQRVRQVQRGEVSAGRHESQLDVAGLASGVYFLRIVHESGTATQRLTVVR